MKFFYSMILLMNAMSICGPEKALTTKLRNNYDLQLAQKQKERESRKLLASVAKKHKICKKNIQQQNEQKQKQNKYIKEKLHQTYEQSFIQRNFGELVFLGIVFGTPLMAAALHPVYFGIPMGYFECRDVCLCLDI